MKHQASRSILIAAAMFMATAVALGALGAHALRSKLPEAALESYQTGVRYQLVHGLALLIIAVLSDRIKPAIFKWVVGMMSAGILLFSGSIYLLSLSRILGTESWKMILGPITPVGGICLMAAWVLLAMGFGKLK